jgi:hypothetical protein
MDRAAVESWVTAYERAWRTPGTEPLATLFAAEATYLTSPWAEPVAGLAAIARFWEAERDGSDEEFTMASQVLAVDGSTAVVRVQVDYGRPGGRSWRDLWVLGFDGGGRCSSFEEWPFAPAQPDGH